MSEWIPVQKQLPPLNREVLVYLPRVKKIKILILVKEFDERYMWITQSGLSYCNLQKVSHWTNLPGELILNKYAPKYDNTGTENSMFSKKTLEEITADIKKAFEILKKNSDPYLMSREEFNSMSLNDQEFAIWIAFNYPCKLKIEKGPTNADGHSGLPCSISRLPYPLGG